MTATFTEATRELTDALDDPSPEFLRAAAADIELSIRMIDEAHLRIRRRALYDELAAVDARLAELTNLPAAQGAAGQDRSVAPHLTLHGAPPHRTVGGEA